MGCAGAGTDAADRFAAGEHADPHAPTTAASNAAQSVIRFMPTSNTVPKHPSRNANKQNGPGWNRTSDQEIMSPPL